MEDKKPKKIIIKNVKKGHGAAHGGSWKVAYADFVTAMMAFFLLMWLLNMTSSEKRAVMALYFKNFSLWSTGGKSFMMEGGMKPAMKQQSGGTDVVDSGDDSSGGISKDEGTAKLMTGLQTAVIDPSQQQTLMGVSGEGIRIQLVDSPENPIFTPGSAQLTESAKKAIRNITAIVKNFPNEIAVEGHTDGSPIKSEQTSNWELSTARASAARRELEFDGIDPSRIARVVGYADKVPLVQDDPSDARNRRISLVILKVKKQKPPEQFNWLWKQPSQQPSSPPATSPATPPARR